MGDFGKRLNIPPGPVRPECFAPWLPPVGSLRGLALGAAQVLVVAGALVLALWLGTLVGGAAGKVAVRSDPAIGRYVVYNDTIYRLVRLDPGSGIKKGARRGKR